MIKIWFEIYKWIFVLAFYSTIKNCGKDPHLAVLSEVFLEVHGYFWKEDILCGCPGKELRTVITYVGNIVLSCSSRTIDEV